MAYSEYWVGGGGLKIDELAIPNWKGATCIRVKFDLKAYEHKIYPNCSTCGQKYVPITKGGIQCFKCLLTNK